MKKIIFQVIGITIIFFALIIVLSMLLSSCSVHHIEQRQDYKIEFEDSCYTILPGEDIK